MQPALHQLHSRAGVPAMPAEQDRAPAGVAYVHSLVIAAILYMTLAIGKVAAPTIFLEQQTYWHTLAFAAAFLLLFLKPVPFKAMGRAIWILLPFLAVLAVSAFLSEDFAYAQKKLDSAFVVTLLVSAAMAELIARNGLTGAIKTFLFVSLAVLALTIAYKLQSDPFDRQSRFLFNGPIVFGWLMGFNALLALHIYLSEKRSLGWLIAAAGFALAVLWTASKGPLVALVIVFLVMLSTRLSWRSMAVLLVLPPLSYYLAQYVLPDGVLDRLSAIERIFSGQTVGSDAGSIGARSETLSDAFAMFFEHPLFGVGLGNFQFNGSTTFIYPHSIVPEALAEMGIAGALALLLVIGRTLVATAWVGKFILLYFLVALSFSGDLSYIHLALGVPLAMIPPRALAGQQRM